MAGLCGSKGKEGTFWKQAALLMFSKQLPRTQAGYPSSLVLHFPPLSTRPVGPGGAFQYAI